MLVFDVYMEIKNMGRRTKAIEMKEKPMMMGSKIATLPLAEKCQ